MEQSTGLVLDAEDLVVEVIAIHRPLLVGNKVEQGTAFTFATANLLEAQVVVVEKALVGGNDIVQLPVLDHIIHLHPIELVATQDEMGGLLRCARGQAMKIQEQAKQQGEVCGVFASQSGNLSANIVNGMAGWDGGMGSGGK